MMTEHRVVTGLLDDEGATGVQTLTSPSSTAEEMVVLADPRPVIPVIFLPGIMGTNLRNKHTGRRVWRPLNTSSITLGNGNWAEVGWAKDFFLATAAERRRWLDPETTEVDPRGKIHFRINMNKMPGKLDEKRRLRLQLPKLRSPTFINMDWKHLAISEREAYRRGFGALMQSAYQPVMANMEAVLNRLVQGGEICDSWSHGDSMFGMLADPAEYGEKKGATQLTQEEVRQAANYRFEFWAGGYNWIRSNADSAGKIIERIEKNVLGHYRKTLGESAAAGMKVLLMTHSMGGLVARSMIANHNYKRVLGSVIGAMPAEGAALTYKMMRTGADSMAMKLIAQGNTAIHLVAQLSNSNGALELLPTSRYGGDGNGWLRVRRSGAGKLENDDTLPKESNPYDEIYRSREWYGLVPERNGVALDMAGTQDAAGYESRTGGLDPFAEFDTKIDEVKRFHDQIDGKCPSPAYVHVGADGHKKRLAYDEVAWNVESGVSVKFEGLFLRGSPFKGALYATNSFNEYSSPTALDLDSQFIPEWMRSSGKQTVQQRRHATAMLNVFRANLENQMGAGFTLETANANGVWGDSLNGRVVLGLKADCPSPPVDPVSYCSEEPAIVLDELVITAYASPIPEDILATTAEKSGVGDETVPYISAVSPLVWRGVEAFFAIGDEGSSNATGKKVWDIKGRRTKGYEHQDAYNDNRARWASLFSVIRLAQRADWA
ncbi:MAG TPA: hypothetical protein H9827_02675 [Candidatus Luteimonas excrementigallinarum]|nr:hypothetical protein [Candidatus Luteimonas excrementigallinarum]